jgi:hypothetical protein
MSKVVKESFTCDWCYKPIKENVGVYNTVTFESEDGKGDSYQELVATITVNGEEAHFHKECLPLVYKRFLKESKT